MAEEKKTLAVRAPRDWYDEVDDHAEERGISKSDVLRRATKAYLDDKSNNSVSRAASPLALLGVICLAVAPTLLATGYVLVGALAGVVAAAYVLLWVTATDVLVEEALGTAREELQAVGGVRGFFRAVIFEDRVVDDPETLVERSWSARAPLPTPARSSSRSPRSPRSPSRPPATTSRPTTRPTRNVASRLNGYSRSSRYYADIDTLSGSLRYYADIDT